MLSAITEPTVAAASTKLSAASFNDDDDLDVEYTVDQEQQSQDEQDQTEGEDAEEEVLSDEEVDDIVQGSMHVLLPEGRSKVSYRDTISGAEMGDSEGDEDFKEDGESETEDDDEVVEGGEHDDEEMHDVDDQEIADLVCGTEFVENAELFSTSSKVLKSGKKMGAEIREITDKIQEMRAFKEEDAEPLAEL